MCAKGKLVMPVFGILFSLITTLASMQSAKDEFIFNNEGEVESLDPAFSTGVPDNNLVIQMFEGLLTHKSDWVTLTPGAAESMPTISKDGKTYTFKVRKGLKW